MSQTEDIIQKIDYFQNSADASKVLELIDAPGTAGKDIIDALQYDIPLTANILKICNSSMFAFEGGIHSIKDAIQKLGPVEFKRAAALTASGNIFAVGEGTGYEAGRGEMRRHSIATAVISRHLVQLVALPEIKSDLFTACLMHDIGKLIMSEYIGEHYKKIVDIIADRECDFSDAENEVIGMTHAEVGARILEKWHFPPQMVTAVRYHHNPEAVPDSPLTHFVALSDRLAMLMGFTTAIDGLEYKGFPQLYKKYKLKESHLELIAMEAIDEILALIPFERRQPKGQWDGIDRRQ
ncbi:MAG: HDOD domain-containing protein [bacterium]|nr:HDOD domain-containing protein [bacterium]